MCVVYVFICVYMCIYVYIYVVYITIIYYIYTHSNTILINYTLIYVGTYRILQAGSSVVTSLCEAESMSHPKHMHIIEIKDTYEFRLKSIPFIHMRAFKYAEISLSEVYIIII